MVIPIRNTHRSGQHLRSLQLEQQTPQEKIKEAHALAQSIPLALTKARKIELRDRVLALLAEAMK